MGPNTDLRYLCRGTTSDVGISKINALIDARLIRLQKLHDVPPVPWSVMDADREDRRQQAAELLKPKPKVKHGSGVDLRLSRLSLLFAIEQTLIELESDDALRVSWVRLQQGAARPGAVIVPDPEAAEEPPPPPEPPLGVDRRRALEAPLIAASIAEHARQTESESNRGVNVRFLNWLALLLCAITVVTAAFAGLAADAPKSDELRIALAVAAGALGGAFSGLMAARVAEHTFAATDARGSTLVIKPIVGAAGGLVLYTLWQGGVFSVADAPTTSWSVTLFLGFAGGLSERLVVGRIEALLGGDPPTTTERRTPSTETQRSEQNTAATTS